MNYSIIIPSKNRADLMETLLESLSVARKNIEGMTEVLIIDDSDLKNAKQIEESAKKYDCTYIDKTCSVAAKRNYGASLAKYEYLLFLDSDVRVSSNLLQAYDAVYAEKKAKAVVGALEFEGKKYWYWDVVNASPFTKCFYMPKGMKELPWGCSCNISFEKELFQELGGFCEDFAYPAGEDVDIGLRISNGKHIKIYPAPEALVYHSNETWRHYKEMHRRVRVYGKADVLLVEKHPDFVVNSGMFRRTAMYVSVLLMSVVIALFTKCWWLLTAPVGFYLLENIGMAMFANHEQKRFGKISLLKQLAVQNLVHTNERAYMWECIRSGKFRYLNKHLIYSYGQACSTLRFLRFTMFLQWILYFIAIAAMLIVII